MAGRTPCGPVDRGRRGRILSDPSERMVCGDRHRTLAAGSVDWNQCAGNCDVGNPPGSADRLMK